MISQNEKLIFTASYINIFKKLDVCIYIYNIYFLYFAIICFSLFICTLSGKFDYDPNLETCSIVKDRHGHTSKTFLFVMGFLIPCVVIVGCYAKIFWVVHK